MPDCQSESHHPFWSGRTTFRLTTLGDLESARELVEWGRSDVVVLAVPWSTGHDGVGEGPQGVRRGQGARERILGASQQLFRDQGINRTGMDQLCAVAQVFKRTAYQHFTNKDELVAEYLRRFDPDVMPGVFDRTDLTPRERLLAVFEMPASTPLCPYIAAAVNSTTPEHPASEYARDYKTAIAARLNETAREAGATHPEQLGEQLALLIDGASARTRVLNSDSFPAAAAVLIDSTIPPSSARQPSDRGT